MENEFQRGNKVVSKDGEIGFLTGGNYKCQMEGCRGARLSVRWADGKITRPCTKGMVYSEDSRTWKMM